MTYWLVRVGLPDVKVRPTARLKPGLLLGVLGRVGLRAGRYRRGLMMTVFTAASPMLSELSPSISDTAMWTIRRS